jgi:hypothetical protein
MVQLTVKMTSSELSQVAPAVAALKNDERVDTAARRTATHALGRLEAVHGPAPVHPGATKGAIPVVNASRLPRGAIAANRTTIGEAGPGNHGR